LASGASAPPPSIPGSPELLALLMQPDLFAVDAEFQLLTVR
jgi:hypothetical protein